MKEDNQKYEKSGTRLEALSDGQETNWRKL
jgi:hypothetical protein